MANFIFTRFKANMMSVSFCGIKENIALGQQALAQVKKDFPNGIKSNTYYETFTPSPNQYILDSYERAIEETRRMVDQKKRQGMNDIDATVEAVKVTGAGNCGEQARIVSKKLSDNGVTNKVILMTLRDNKTNFPRDGHTFCVIDTASDMKVKEPKTWGSDAVVVDLWSNTVAKASEALEYFCSIMKPNKEQHVSFEDGILF